MKEETASMMKAGEKSEINPGGFPRLFKGSIWHKRGEEEKFSGKTLDKCALDEWKRNKKEKHKTKEENIKAPRADDVTL